MFENTKQCSNSKQHILDIFEKKNKKVIIFNKNNKKTFFRTCLKHVA